MKFTKHYFTEAKSFKLELDPWIKDLFSKDRVRNIKINVDKLPYLKKVSRSAYNTLLDSLSRNYKNPKAKKSNIYIKNLYSGTIKDDAVNLDDYVDVNDITIYKTNNGGMIVLFNLQDENGKSIQYIGINKKGHDYFKKFFGMTFGAFVGRADALVNKYSKLRKKTNDIYATPKQLFDYDGDGNIDTMDLDGDGEDDQSTEQELGIVKIPDTLFDVVILFNWDPKTNKHLKNIFKKTPFSNNWGKGFKYEFAHPKKGSVYILKNHDPASEKAVIIFDSKEAYEWADKKEMLTALRLQKTPRWEDPVWTIQNINKIKVK